MILPSAAQAASTVFINEISWMGSNISSNDEWLELYNSGDKEANLAGWKLRAIDGTPDISLSGVIAPFGYFLLERTDDNSAPGVPADLLFKGSLENGGEDLVLTNEMGEIVDQISGKWPAGDNETKRTMERAAAGWQTSALPGGTPRAANSAGTTLPASAKPETAKTAEPEPPASNNYPVILINEILPAPEGADAENEWIELYNPTNGRADLSGWKINDREGKTVIFTIPKGTAIEAFGYLVFKRTETGIMMNNEKDTIELINPAGAAVDSVSYNSAGLGQSFARQNNSWKWTDNPTPKGANGDFPAAISDAKSGVATENEDKNQPQAAAALAESPASQKLPPPSPALPIYAIAALLALFSAASIVVLKKSLRPERL